MSNDSILDELELQAIERIKQMDASMERIRHMDELQEFTPDCKECNIFENCRFYEQKTGDTLCEVIDVPGFSNPEKEVLDNENLYKL